MSVAHEKGAAIELAKVDDLTSIIGHGVIDGVIVRSVDVPARSEFKGWFLGGRVCADSFRWNGV